MVIQIAKKGPNSGKQFLGCSNFPNCKATKKLDHKKNSGSNAFDEIK
jgi:ssDNA-binding Zn-finger/Zn-ribbon topoisomerase 1